MPGEEAAPAGDQGFRAAVGRLAGLEHPERPRRLPPAADRLARRSGSRPRFTSSRKPSASGLEAARPGDLLVIFGDDLNRDWEQIVAFGGRHGAPPPTARPVFAPETQPLWNVPDRRPNQPEETEGED